MLKISKVLGSITLSAWVVCISIPILAQDKPIVINEISKWKHPEKRLFKKYNVKPNKVEISNKGNYFVYYVDFIWDPQTSPNAKTLSKLEFALFEANGRHNFSLQADKDKIRIEIVWDTKEKLLEENTVPL
jgi:hypothetical protein